MHRRKITALVVDGVQNSSESLEERRDAAGLRQTLLYFVDSLILDGNKVLSGRQHRQRIARLAVNHDAPRRGRVAWPPPKAVDEPVNGRKAGTDVGEIGTRDVESQHGATMTTLVAAVARRPAVAAAARYRRPSAADTKVDEPEHRVTAQ